MSYATYIILFNLYLSIWLGIYLLTARKKQVFNLNRIILLLGIIGALILPFISFNAGNTSVHLINKAPSFILEVPNSGIGESFNNTNNTYLFWKITRSIYWLGVGITSFILLFKISKLYLIILKNRKVNQKGYIHVVLSKENSPFSFLNYLFSSENISISAFEHEKIHIQQKHSIDNLIMEIIKVLSWFNPLVYTYHKNIRINHEYIADSETLKKVDVVTYSEELVKQAFKVPKSSFIQPFNSNSQIKNRLIMLKNRNKPTKKVWTYGVFVPTLAFVIILTSSFSLKNKLENTFKELKPITETNQPESAKKEVEEFIYNDAQDGDTIAANFKGGQQAMMQYLSENIVYPKSEMDSKTQGVVYLKLLIESDGKVKDAIVLRGVSKKIDLEAVRVLKGMPAWEPATVNGKSIPFEAVIPIRFSLN